MQSGSYYLDDKPIFALTIQYVITNRVIQYLAIELCVRDNWHGKQSDNEVLSKL